MSDIKRNLVVAFVDFLKSEIQSGQLGEDAVEGLEGIYIPFGIILDSITRKQDSHKMELMECVEMWCE